MNNGHVSGYVWVVRTSSHFGRFYRNSGIVRTREKKTDFRTSVPHPLNYVIMYFFLRMGC
jgi:hypothetical protein